MRTTAFVVAAAILALASAACDDIDSNPSGSTVIPSTSPSPSPTPILEQGQTQEQLNTAQGAIFSGNEAGQLDYSATVQYLEAVIQHTDTVWTNWFLSIGLPEPWVGYEIIEPSEQYQSNCTLDGQNVFGSNYPNAFYCNRDRNGTDAGMVVLPVETMAKMWTGNVFERQVSDLSLVGDFAAGVITAHEFGHHIQDELTENYGIAAPANPGIELISDCFAGVWTYSVQLDQYLEEGDIDEALNALAAIGDNQGSHGTGAERKNAFLIGLYGSEANPVPGVPYNCVAAFWPELAAVM